MFTIKLAKTCQIPQNNVDEAEAMFRKSLSWRKQRGVDFVLNWKPPEVLRKYYPGGFTGFDSCGCPVWIIPYGHLDMKGMEENNIFFFSIFIHWQVCWHALVGRRSWSSC